MDAGSARSFAGSRRCRVARRASGTIYTASRPLNTFGFAVEGRALEPQDQRPQGHFKFISPGYFEPWPRLIAGRGLSWSDIEAGGRVVVVSEDFARQLATEPAAALGLRMRFANEDQDAWREVIGVVQSIHEQGVYAEPPAMVYWPAFTEDCSGRPA
jgi:hypothetical protein